MPLSAYVSLFDDWELLQPALTSLAQVADDIVIVDGAYEWTVPFLGADRPDATRSLDQVYDVLALYGRRVRVLTGTWKTETAKRQAGFEACRGRYAIRADADEVLLWQQRPFEAFLSSNAAIAEVETPVYVAPGIIGHRRGMANVERQAFFFDRDRISSKQHLSYLWLLLPPCEKTSLATCQPDLVFHEPIAFNAHLSHWRTPATSLNRTRFFVLNYIRSAGRLPWMPEFEYDGDASLAELAAMLPAKQFNDILLGDKIVACPPEMDRMILSPSPCNTAEESSFSGLHDQMLNGLAELNAGLTERPRTMVSGLAYYFDISRPASLTGLVTDGAIRLAFSQPILKVTMTLQCLMLDGTVLMQDLPVEVSGTDVHALLEAPRSIAPAWLRRTLVLNMWTSSSARFVEFQSGLG